MLETILKLYTMAMATGVRSPLPHLYGPPGCNKSSAVEQAAQIIGVNLHIINVSRLSPLEVEGVQMPQGSGEEMLLKMLPATFWTQLKKGDIVLFDEFLRGFPEVYNGLLDILTARRVGGFTLPEVFFIAASNSTIAYDKALEDRLLHIPVEDPRKSRSHKKHLGKVIVDALGLLPEMAQSAEMTTLLDLEVLPMFTILDSLGNGGTSPMVMKGSSVRKLIGQAQLRQVESSHLAELISMNNHRAIGKGKMQFVFLLTGKNADMTYVKKQKLLPEDKLTEVQLLNLQLNRQLLELETARIEQEGIQDDGTPDNPPF